VAGNPDVTVDRLAETAVAPGQFAARKRYRRNVSLKSGTTSLNPSSSGGVTGSAPGWPTDEKIEALRAAWFAATDEAQRRDLGD